MTRRPKDQNRVIDAISINFGALCRYDEQGQVTSVMIPTQEFDYLCRISGLQPEPKHIPEAPNYCILDYPVFHELVAMTQVAEWNQTKT